MSILNAFYVQRDMPYEQNEVLTIKSLNLKPKVKTMNDIIKTERAFSTSKYIYDL